MSEPLKFFRLKSAKLNKTKLWLKRYLPKQNLEQKFSEVVRDCNSCCQAFSHPSLFRPEFAFSLKTGFFYFNGPDILSLEERERECVCVWVRACVCVEGERERDSMFVCVCLRHKSRLLLLPHEQIILNDFSFSCCEIFFCWNRIVRFFSCLNLFLTYKSTFWWI